MSSFFTGSGYLLYLIIVAGLLHASLQLPGSTLVHVLTTALGKRKNAHIPLLGFCFIIGALIGVAALIILGYTLIELLPNLEVRRSVAGGLAVVTGIAIMIFYFKRSRVAALWIPRSFSHYLQRIAKQKKRPLASTIQLGTLAVIFEGLLSFPLVLVACTIALLDAPENRLSDMMIYAACVCLPVFSIAVSFAAGTSPATMQRWRSDGKHFWQFFLGLAFVCFGIYTIVGQYAPIYYQMMEVR